jgi:hypothetical protein
MPEDNKKQDTVPITQTKSVPPRITKPSIIAQVRNGSHEKISIKNKQLPDKKG